MAKLSIFFLLCSLSMALGNYYYYPSASAGALSYYPYQNYGYGVAPYVIAEPDCDKKEKGESSSSSSESSSEESSSSESSEEGEKKEKKEEGESKEGEEKEEGEEKKEGEEKEESSSSSSSSSSEESKEEKKEEKKKEKKEEKEEKSLFPPRAYAFPPVEQMVYAQPNYPYMPYKSYSVIQSAPVKSPYMAAPYAAPAMKSYSPMTKIIATAPAARYVSVPASYPVAKSYSGYPSYGVLGMSGYLGNNVGYYKA